MNEYVVLMAVQVEADSWEGAQQAAMTAMPKPMNTGVIAWWVAEDDRPDGSDNDSAVFCIPGRQQEAFDLLNAAMLSDDCNDPRRSRA